MKMYAHDNYELAITISKYGKFEYNLIFNIILFILIWKLFKSTLIMYRILNRFLKVYQNDKFLDFKLNFSFYLLIFILSLIPLIITIRLTGNTNSQIVQTVVIFNEAVNRFTDPSIKDIVFSNYLTHMYFSITPTITLIWFSGSITTLGLQIDGKQ